MINKATDEISIMAHSFPSLPIIAGVKMASGAANIKYQNRDDLVLFQFDANSYVAGVVTKSSIVGAPVVWSKPILKLGRAQALLVNSGNANVATGAHGIHATEMLAEHISANLNIPLPQILQASTGVIGEKLPWQNIASCLDSLYPNLTDDGWQQAAHAIMTTDTYPKAQMAKAQILGTEVNIVGIAKGSGMIAPNMATMLSFIFTDAAIAPHLLKNMTKQLVNETFNNITVDGDTSTSDMVIVVATGRAQNQLTDSDAALADFKQALHRLMHQLSCDIIRDGEGASKFIKINITGAKDDESAKIIGKMIANSPLVKTAIAGEDPNWGRIIMAIGKSGEPLSVDTVSIGIGEQMVFRHGELSETYRETLAQQYLQGAEITLNIDLGLAQGKAQILTCDFTHDYIKINADYRN